MAVALGKESTLKAPLPCAWALWLIFTLAACSPRDDESGTARDPAPKGGSPEISIFLSDEVGIALDCSAVRSLQWVASTIGDLPSLAIRRVIRDVQPSPSIHPQDTAPLLEYFNEVRIQGSTAVASFDGGALTYLNSSACMQAVVKTPIVRTLLEFPGVDEVIWEIDGRIFEAWDA